MKVQFSKLVLVLISMIFLVSCGGGGGGVPTTVNTATIPNTNNISSTNNIPTSQKKIGSNFIFNSSPKQNEITTLKISVNNSTQIDDIEWSVSNEPINSHLSIKISSDKKSLSFTPQISGEYKITAKVKYDNQYYSLETLSFTIKEEFALDLKNLEVYDHPISKDVNFNLNEVVSTVKNQFWVFSKSLNESQLRSLIQTTYSDFTIKGYDPIYGLLVETNNPASIELLRKRSNIDKVYNRVYVGDNAYKTNAIYPIDNGNFDDGGSNWHLEVINMPEAWEYTTGNDNFLIGVCDGGFDNQHNDLQNRFAIFLTNQEDSHGMGVTGAIVANSNNGIGISGINWSSQVVASYMGDVENTINTIQNNKVVRLISNSWGYEIPPNFDPTNSTMTDDRFRQILSAMAQFRQLVEQRMDKLFIWAAGNGVGRGASSSGYYGVNAIYDNGIIHYDTTSRISSKLDNLIIVGAFISDKRLVYYSNFGDTVDIAAPTHFDSLALNNQIYQNFGGTSASTPVVSGIASLIMSINPNLSPAEVKSILINSATEYITERYVSPFTNTIEKLAHPIPILNAREALIMASETLTSNKSPIVNVESNKNADETTTVTLNATASDSDGSIEKIEWKQTAGTTITINNQNTLNASFTAPNVDVDTDLTFRLTVTDNDGATANDDVVVTVKNVVIPNQSPTVTVENDKSVDEATTVTLDGSGSDIDGSISSYFWEQVSGNTVNIINKNSANASFIAPNVDIDTALTFRLTVMDDDGATASDDVVVTVKNVVIPNQSPTVTVENDKSVDEATTVTLDGSGSDIDGTISSYFWEQVSGNTVTITNEDSANASFTAPNVDSDTSLTFRLTVTDDDGATASDDVVVTVKNVVIPNQSPTVTVENDKSVDEATTVSLNGSGSDIDGTISSYFWEQVSGNTVTITNEDSANASFTAPNVDSDTSLIFRLTVTDDDGATANDDVVVTVKDISVIANDDIFGMVCPAYANSLDINSSDPMGVNVLLNDIGDISNTTLTVTEQPTNAKEFTLDNNGYLHYNSNSTVHDFKLGDIIDTFTYKLSNGNSEDTATVNIIRIAGSFKCSATPRPPAPNVRPKANAGSEISANEATTVTLNGSGSDIDGVITNYQWTQVSGNPVTITDENSANIFFIVPNVDIDTDLTFRLTVTDNDGATASDDVVVTIKNVVIPNQSPTVTVEDDKNVDEATTVSLNGGGSDIDGSISSYFWEQVSGTTVNIINQYSANASFIAPNVDIDTDLTFRLTVTDNDGATASDTIIVTIINTVRFVRDNTAEIVIDNELDLMWQDNEDVNNSNLFGKSWVTAVNYYAGDYYNTFGDTAQTYCDNISLGGYTDWKLPTLNELESIVNKNNNPAIEEVFKNLYITGPYFTSTTSPSGEKFVYVIYFGYGALVESSKVDPVWIRCVRDNQSSTLPIANAGKDQVVKQNESVNFDASGSSDDNQIVSYEWKEESTLLSNSISFTKNDFFKGFHTITLTVTDNDGATASDTMIVYIGDSTNWKTSSMGYNHSVGLKSDGTLWTWGNNEFNQLGDGTKINKYIPTQIGTSTIWSSVVAGYHHNIGIKYDGTLWTWGWNNYGQLGDATIVDKSTPTQIGSSTNWSSVYAGYYHTIALKNDGTLWGWGKNLYGELGDGTKTNRYVPTQIGNLNNWNNIATGAFHTVAIKSDGTLWTWGNNYNGQLGDETTIDKTTPTQIGSSTNWNSASAGIGHTVAIKSDGTLWAWGSNEYGQLGDETTVDKTAPTQIGSSTNWNSVSAGGYHTVAIKSDGTLWSWGKNNSGQLGDGTKIDKTIPTQIGNLNNWNTIFSRIGHTLALNSDGILWSWGWNYSGELGDGTTINKSAPTKVTLIEQ